MNTATCNRSFFFLLRFAHYLIETSKHIQKLNRNFLQKQDRNKVNWILGEYRHQQKSVSHNVRILSKSIVRTVCTPQAFHMEQRSLFCIKLLRNIYCTEENTYKMLKVVA